jgi:hypothetical protein
MSKDLILILTILGLTLILLAKSRNNVLPSVYAESTKKPEIETR